MSVNEMLMAAAGNAGGPDEYVEDVFSTWVYQGNWAGTGNTNTITINPGLDMSGKGGLVWFKNRTTDLGNILLDTNRGANSVLLSNKTDRAEPYDTWNFNRESIAFTSTGVNAVKTAEAAGDGYINYDSTRNFVSWLFRKAPKFFDVVTWTGNDVAGRTIAHSLGSTPGMLIVKNTSIASNWRVWHRSLSPSSSHLNLNQTDAAANLFIFATPPSSTVITLSSSLNNSGENYVAYLFAHNAGGFGAAGTDNIISCGSYTGNGTTGNTVTLGYEPQYVLIKRTDSTGSWILQDVMRGMSNTALEYLLANTAGPASNDGVPYLIPTATGFTLNSNAAWNASGGTYIYMAIRRPMKTPTTGTEVFSPFTAPSAGYRQTGFPVDMFFNAVRSNNPAGYNTVVQDRLRGPAQWMVTSSTQAETNWSIPDQFQSNTGISPGFFSNDNVTWSFRRAPGFFDVVCYTGTGSNRTITHNLGVVPELMIVKRRNAAAGWIVYHTGIGATAANLLNNGTPVTATGYWNDTAPTASVFSLGTFNNGNASGSTYVAYLFATLAGVSKVGSYTGNGSSQTINCGFSAGARFVLIKRTDSTGDWCVFDTARGIVSGNDPFLQLNLTDAEVTGEDAVDPANSGFIVNQTTENLNVNNATYIFYAVA